MPNKNIYIKDDDSIYWDKAKDLAGESLSQLLTTYVKQFVRSEEANKQGYTRLVMHYLQLKMVHAKAFHGRWLIAPEAPFTADTGKNLYSVAITAKNNVLIYHQAPSLVKHPTLYWGKYHTYSSFEEAAKDDELPYSLLPEAMEKMGIEVEELDI